MSPILPLEVCVDSPEGLDAAIAGGADRIELCSALALGGLTPGPGLIAAAAACGTPCHAMIRPRDGDFVLRAGDLKAMRADVAAIRRAGLAGIVVGASLDNHALDDAALAALIDAGDGLEVTLHRAFDLTPDPFAALDLAISLGVTRILTSGQAATAPAGADMLARLVAHAGGRIQIMAGGGVTAAAASALMATCVDALHASCRAPDPAGTDASRIGIAPRQVTDARKVAALKAAMREEALCL
ncbi:MAG: copper homeostasis protein CutC [Pseudomonadota bacterium]